VGIAITILAVKNIINKIREMLVMKERLTFKFGMARPVQVEGVERMKSSYDKHHLVLYLSDPTVRALVGYKKEKDVW